MSSYSAVIHACDLEKKSQYGFKKMQNKGNSFNLELKLKLMASRLPNMVNFISENQVFGKALILHF